MTARRMVDGQAEKQCLDCKEWFPETSEFFYRMRSGLRHTCKPCFVAAVQKHKPAAKPKLRNAAAILLDGLTRRWGRMA